MPEPKPKRSPRARKPAALAGKGVKTMEAQKKKPAGLLAGGNPQIAKGDGEGPVRAYIAAMPGWKSDVGKRLDALIARTVPAAQKAVRWNSPMYSLPGIGWFVSFHVFTRFVRVTFFNGRALKPLPPGPSKQKRVRYLDIYEGDPVDETRMAAWIKQAAALPGWLP